MSKKRPELEYLGIELKPVVMRALREMCGKITGDIDEYAEQITETAILLAKCKAMGSKYKKNVLRLQRHLKAQAGSLSSITTAREARRWEKVWWISLKLMVSTLKAVL